MSRRVLVYGEERREAEMWVLEAGLRVVRREPELVLTHGGDGTLLRAERMFPGVPKLPVRSRRTVRLCPEHSLPGVLQRLLSDVLVEQRLELLELGVGRRAFHALNDVVLRNDNPAVAVRFRVRVDERDLGEMTGDGLVVATVFGSTGYYRSITRGRVESGFGLAFNNVTRVVEPVDLAGHEVVTVALVRGPAVLVYDNDTRPIPVRDGHRFSVRRAGRTTTVLGLDALACQECRREDGAGFNPH